ncbi:MAG: exodeoxyribonuclease VII small subunit [Candidatus Kapaibacterium sp.]|nr:exodeoxyribonuclease VII small subunit [Bacteroidota bacterium]
MKKKTLTFEEQLQRLEEIRAILDAGEEPVESMLQLYEEGMKLAAEMQAFLEKAELRVQEIQNT